MAFFIQSIRYTFYGHTYFSITIDTNFIERQFVQGKKRQFLNGSQCFYAALDFHFVIRLRSISFMLFFFSCFIACSIWFFYIFLFLRRLFFLHVHLVCWASTVDSLNCCNNSSCVCMCLCIWNITEKSVKDGKKHK